MIYICFLVKSCLVTMKTTAETTLFFPAPKLSLRKPDWESEFGCLVVTLSLTVRGQRSRRFDPTPRVEVF